jgi:hypothetical protein
MNNRTILILILAVGLGLTSCGTKKVMIQDQKEIFDISGLPYYLIPTIPQEYTAEHAAARMIDGLGFRFYWATEGLRKDDLAFRISKESRTSEETIDHIMGLSAIILNSVTGKPNTTSGEETSAMDFPRKRARTLHNLLEASNMLKSGKIKAKDVIMTSSSGASFDYWHIINGPIADALWHVGQVVSFRRGSGNPINPKASVLRGKLMP